MRKKLFLFFIAAVLLTALPEAGISCFSDFDCGIGYKCVKAPFESSGVCMKTVNEFGVQQYDLPSLDSINPRYEDEGNCDFDLDCPIGFYCNQKYKVCIKRW